MLIFLNIFWEEIYLLGTKG